MGAAKLTFLPLPTSNHEGKKFAKVNLLPLGFLVMYKYHQEKKTQQKHEMELSTMPGCHSTYCFRVRGSLLGHVVSAITGFYILLYFMHIFS